MKKLIIFAAPALAFAAPAVAQATPAQAPHDHSQHAAGHPGQPPAGQRDEHAGHAMKDGCCADKDGNGKMDCCEKMQRPPTAPQR